jgi:hypothetical protein
MLQSGSNRNKPTNHPYTLTDDFFNQYPAYKWLYIRNVGYIWSYVTFAPIIAMPLKSQALRSLLITPDTKAVACTGN